MKGASLEVVNEDTSGCTFRSSYSKPKSTAENFIYELSRVDGARKTSELSNVGGIMVACALHLHRLGAQAWARTSAEPSGEKATTERLMLKPQQVTSHGAPRKRNTFELYRI
jgi:hypothetical protein